MSDEQRYPELERFDAFMNRKVKDEPLVEIPDIPANASAEEIYKILVRLGGEVLAVIAADPKQPASARVAAVKEINDRAEGKAVAKMEVEHTVNHIHKHLEKAKEIRKLRYEPDMDIIEAEIVSENNELPEKVDTEAHI